MMMRRSWWVALRGPTQTSGQGVATRSLYVTTIRFGRPAVALPTKEAALPAQILDGKALAATIRAEVAGQVAEHRATTGRIPGLAVVLVGENPASRVYVRNKQAAAEAAGIAGTLIRLPANVAEDKLLATIDALNADPAVHGILVQLPLPPQISDERVIERIDPLKDVDGFHPENAGLLAIGRPRFIPCTPLGIRELLIASGVETRGKDVVILGRSQIVGKSLALAMLQKGPGGDATVTVCHASTRDVAAHARRAEILVAAVGRPGAVRGDMVRPGAVVIDVGINRDAAGKLCGDVAYDEVAAVAGWITPVPGGVGPMTVALLIRNTWDAFRRLESVAPGREGSLQP